ncbi:MAG: hypothetical protein M1838_003195 [Thelocarpon superellum]|nr:MAG: hypothetical protein M1838_003195 [Thelocarpon superellum]
MTLPSPQPPQDSTASGTDHPSGRRSTASHQASASSSAAAAAPAPARRLVLTPISTAVGAAPWASPARSTSQSSPRATGAPSTSTASPFASSFSSVLNASLRDGAAARPNAPSNAASAAAFPTLQQAGSQQSPASGPQLSSPRSRANPPAANRPPSSSASSNAGPHAGGSGAGGGGGGGQGSSTSNANGTGTSTGKAFTHSPSYSQSNIQSPNSPSSATAHNANNQAGQLSKIVIAQVFLLLSTIKEDKDNTKWDSQADQIRKLIQSNGMEVFAKYFRRLVVGNAPQIFPGINRPVENAGNYPLLVAELRKLAQDPDQARKIAEALAVPDGDLFRDFDLSTFLEHFKLDAIDKTLLALACKTTTRADLRNKADAILASSFQRLLELLATAAMTADQKYADLPPPVLLRLLDGMAQHPPPNLNDEARARLAYAVRRHFEAQSAAVPMDVAMALHLLTLLDARPSLVRLLLQAGPSATATPDACRDLLATTNVPLDAAAVAAALVGMIAHPDWELYRPANVVRAVRDHTSAHPLDWTQVVRGFDRDGLRIDEPRFLKLYDALRPVAEEDATCDLQLLWSGRWQWPETLLAFVTVFLSLSPTVLDASTIPRLRPAFTTADFDDASDAVKEDAAEAVKYTLVSLDAMTALFELIANNPGFFMSTEGQQIFQQVVQQHTHVFLCAAIAVEKPWTETQQGIYARLFFPFLFKQHPKYAFVLHGLWKQDKQWVATRLVEAHAQDPLKLPLLLEHAEEHDWSDDLLLILNAFGIDLAALAHRRGMLDLEPWAQTNAQRGPQEFAFALSRFLTIKAEDEMKTVRKDQAAPRTISLAVRTVNTMLEILEDLLSEERREEGELVAVQRLCIQAYPRLINYGEGFDDLIDANGENSNSIPEGADALMQEHYKRMYNGERDVRDIVGALQRYKQSRDPGEQDLFACMIHGLFDEYSCFREYPLEALATTAVLFGGIINFNLIAGIPLRVGLGMILEAVRDYPPESSMYKFGLQALLHFFNRLQEWPGFCNFLLQVPGLQGTEAYNKAEEIVHERAQQLSREGDGAAVVRGGGGGGGGGGDVNGLGSAANGFSDDATLTNGNVDELFPSDPGPPRFASLHVDPVAPSERDQDPDEETQDKVLFVLNNISEQNIEAKLTDLKEAVAAPHFRWFAGYLVEERAKMQPNFHQLYLDMLERFGDKLMWAQVLRETYVSVIRMLNAPGTLESSTERAHLKNLGGWLGSLTIARDKPIKHRHIAFKELLIEAYDTQRLLLAIPFTCKVLAQARRSVVFKPPNPWIMDILGLLIELYHYAELRLQLKFEIEVLCKDLSLDHTALAPSTSLRERPHPDDDLAGPPLPDGLEGFEDLAIAGLGRNGARTDRFSPAAITSSLPDVGALLVYPPTANTGINHDSLRYIVENAVRKAIQEIIAPVVERSVTIAAISTAQLIHKDFAMEPNEDRVRASALTMVKALAGSLALVTCKEPLRMSMTNYIRVLSAEVGDQPLPEGAILMCVNDNLDTACNMVESAAEQRSMPEIEENIEQQLVARRRHRAIRPNEPFVDPILNRWSFYIPEPYKQSPTGLNKEQMAIYEDFARQSRGPPGHTNASSTDSGRQMVNDVLQEPFPAMPSLPTPAETPAVPRQATIPTATVAGPTTQRLMQSSTAAVVHPQLNGFTDAKSAHEQLDELLSTLLTVVKDLPDDPFQDRAPSDPAFALPTQILRLVALSTRGEDLSFMTAKKVCQILYTELEKPGEIELFVQLLKRLCDTSPVTAREVTMRLAHQDDEQPLPLMATVALVRVGLLELQRVDGWISRQLQHRHRPALDYLTALMDQVLFSARPTALRADFALSLDAMEQWLQREPDLEPAQQIVRRLRDAGVPEGLDGAPDERSRARREQMEYAFHEWVQLCGRDLTDQTAAAFIGQLHQKRLLGSQEESCLFFRVGIDMAVDAYEQHEPSVTGSVDEAFLCVDALAKLILLLMRYQSEREAESARRKTAYLRSTLSLVVLVLNHHHVMRGERFNQKVFFRLFSSLLCEHHGVRSAMVDADPSQDTAMALVLAETFLTLQPAYFPGFAFAWLSLIAHRYFLPTLLLLPDQAVRGPRPRDAGASKTNSCSQGWAPYTSLMEALLSFVGDLLKPLHLSTTSKDLYRGTLRTLLVLHHDFPEFLAENHHRLCGAIPAHCTQLRNLVLSAYPSSFPELPDPFTAGLKVDRIHEIRTSPTIAGDFEAPLRRAQVKDLVDAALASGPTDEHVARLVRAIGHPAIKETGVAFVPVPVDLPLLTSLVLYVGSSAMAAVGQKGGPTFVQHSAQAALFHTLVRELGPEARYHLLGAIANQLRYPNSHTHYFSYLLLFLFGSDQNDQQESDVRQQITRVLLERLIVHRPHPWGLIITLLELLKNPTYMFWDLPFIKAAPEVGDWVRQRYGAGLTPG